MSQHQVAFPAFFDAAPSLTVRDPLAEFLGAAEDGVIDYHYADAVRLAGHSCPTVAGTWLMTVHGLKALYGSSTPVRGDVSVYFTDSRDSGATGVMAAVAQLLTGAAPETGFHGIGGRFSRHQLMHFDQPLDGTMGLRRNDTRAGVQVALDASVVPWGDDMRTLMPLAVSGQGSADDVKRFGQLWQARVEQMLTQHASDPQMIQVRDWPLS